MIFKIKAKQTILACTLISMLGVTACSGNPTAAPTVSEGKSGSGPKTVSLSVMTSDRFLELAKQKFEEAHPDIKIEIKEYAAAPNTATKAQGPGQNIVMMTKPDPKNIEKYVSSVGAELMSGKASDLIVTSNLPYKKYADKKLLENMGDMMNKDASFPKDNYYTGVFEAMKYDGVLYNVPVRIGLNKWLGNLNVLGSEKIDDTKWTWADFKKLAQNWMADKNNDGKPDAYPLGKIDPDQLITLMLNSSYNKFVDAGGKKASFDKPEFINLLKLAKSMYDDNIIQGDNADKDAVVFQPKSNLLMYMDMYAMPKMSFDGKSSFYDLPSENETRGSSFTSSLPVAMNSKSPNKKEAWEFVKFLLSDEMQSTMELNGFAVNKNGAKAQGDTLKKLGSGEGGKNMKLNINGKSMTLQPATDEEIAAIEKAVSNAKVIAESDPKISMVVAEETAPFFQGQKSAEEVAKVIQNKVSTYLQE
ncbi:ABC transporter substrate-binding protein [Paenibacillus planticolens]|uniref:Extracellular solute-binding protein n=1 Tax=Paenibacillus planticolens TaxID=2654976 RepID=A0ABX1ZQ19_9BACL|nr:extracellular solute-binding protein [Paenibacillus planticolens]NOV02172.1 extracellular solute-binding protein [Paenibacillus planticolens]